MSETFEIEREKIVVMHVYPSKVGSIALLVHVIDVWRVHVDLSMLVELTVTPCRALTTRSTYDDRYVVYIKHLGLFLNVLKWLYHGISTYPDCYRARKTFQP